MAQGILLELPLAGFFLKKLLLRGCDLNDLPTLDAELYRSLLLLRDYAGDVEDLALTFTVSNDAFGDNSEVRRGASVHKSESSVTLSHTIKQAAVKRAAELATKAAPRFSSPAHVHRICNDAFGDNCRVRRWDGQQCLGWVACLRAGAVIKHAGEVSTRATWRTASSQLPPSSTPFAKRFSASSV